MPIPMPDKGEKKDDFVSRCMGDNIMNKDYPDQKQRSGICYSQWNEHEKKKEKKGEIMMDITKESIKTAYPDIFAEITAEAMKEGFDDGFNKGEAQGTVAGAKVEMERIKGVEAQCIPGHEALISSLKYDGKTTGPEAAVKVLAAEKEARAGYLKKMKDGAAKPVDQQALGAGEDRPEDGDFEAEVAKYQTEHKCKRSEAIVAVAKEKPELHEKYLSKINK